MFATEFQTGLTGVEILSPAGKIPPSRLLKINGAPALIAKDYDRDIKGFKYMLTGKGSQTSSIQCPSVLKDSLGLTQPLLVLQLKSLVQEDPLNLEVLILDKAGQRRRFLFSTTFRTIDVNALHVQIPWIQPNRETWTNVVFNLQLLAMQCFSATFASIESFILRPLCSLRKIFTLPSALLLPGELDDTLIVPPAFDFPMGTISGTYLFSLKKPSPASTKQPLSSAPPATDLQVSGLQIRSRKGSAVSASGSRVSDSTTLRSGSATSRQKGFGAVAESNAMMKSDMLVAAGSRAVSAGSIRESRADPIAPKAMANSTALKIKQRRFLAKRDKESENEATVDELTKLLAAEIEASLRSGDDDALLLSSAAAASSASTQRRMSSPSKSFPRPVGVSDREEETNEYDYDFSDTTSRLRSSNASLEHRDRDRLLASNSRPATAERTRSADSHRERDRERERDMESNSRPSSSEFPRPELYQAQLSLRDSGNRTVDAREGVAAASSSGLAHAQAGRLSAEQRELMMDAVNQRSPSPTPSQITRSSSSQRIVGTSVSAHGHPPHQSTASPTFEDDLESEEEDLTQCSSVHSNGLSVNTKMYALSAALRTATMRDGQEEGEDEQEGGEGEEEEGLVEEREVDATEREERGREAGVEIEVPLSVFSWGNMLYRRSSSYGDQCELYSTMKNVIADDVLRGSLTRASTTSLHTYNEDSDAHISIVISQAEDAHSPLNHAAACLESSASSMNSPRFPTTTPRLECVDGAAPSPFEHHPDIPIFATAPAFGSHAQSVSVDVRRSFKEEEGRALDLLDRLSSGYEREALALDVSGDSRIDTSSGSRSRSNAAALAHVDMQSYSQPHSVYPSALSANSLDVSAKNVPSSSEASLTHALTPTPIPTLIHVHALSVVSSSSPVPSDIAAVHVSPHTTATGARDGEVQRHTSTRPVDRHSDRDGVRESEGEGDIEDDSSSPSSSPLLEVLLADLQAVRSELSLREKQFIEEFGESCYRAIPRTLVTV